MDGCPHHNCFAPHTSCALGNIELSQCSNWKGAFSGAKTPDIVTDDVLLPWSGSALGLSDLSFLTARAKPIIVGIAGPESAGKTTLLAAWYLLLGRGLLTNCNWKFGGSFSLSGWEAVAAALRWTPGQAPNFPPHTSSRGARTPGLLHLALRQSSGNLRNFLFADAPGEWFQRWSVDANADDAEGARWIMQHADVLLIVADRQALSGSRLGSARNAFQLLTKRIAAERRGRPVALVWTKSDVAIDVEMEKQIRQSANNVMIGIPEHGVSIFSDGSNETGRGFQELFDWILSMRRPGVVLPPTEASVNDPLFMFGRR